jgi:hypothetical protein
LSGDGVQFRDLVIDGAAVGNPKVRVHRLPTGNAGEAEKAATEGEVEKAREAEKAGEAEKVDGVPPPALPQLTGPPRSGLCHARYLCGSPSACSRSGPSLSLPNKEENSLSRIAA